MLDDINCKTLVDLQYNKDIDELSDLREPLIKDTQKYLLDGNWDSIEVNKLLSQLRIINADLKELKYIKLAVHLSLVRALLEKFYQF